MSVFNKIHLLNFLLVLFAFNNVYALNCPPNNPKAIKKELIIATEATYPPFEFIDENNNIIGFDIEIIDAICKKLGVQYKIIHQPFETLLLGLQTGNFDIAIGAISVNEERLKQVDFTEPYFTDTLTLIYHSNLNLEFSNESLKNKKIAVQAGTVFEKYLRENFKDVKIKIYASNGEALLDLKNKRVDAFLCDGSLIKYWLLKEDKTKYKLIDLDDPSYKNSSAIAVKKNNKEFLNAIDLALKEIKESSNYNLILNKYFVNNKINFTKFFKQVLIGVINTIKIALMALIFGLTLSFIFVFIKITIPKTEYILDFCLIIIRSLPELVVILFAYYGIPFIISKFICTIEINPLLTASFALGLIFSSYATKVIIEIYRSIPAGQTNSGLVLGLNKFLILRRIILPQVLIQALPSLNNLWVILLKDTSIVALVGLSELMGKTNLAANSTGYHFIFYAFAALLYLIITSFFYFMFKKYLFNHINYTK